MGYDTWSLLYGAYEFMLIAVPSGQSNTARLLREPDWHLLRSRLADELRELAGVVEGSHVHRGLPDDLVLEASQVCYWAFVSAVAAGLTWSAITQATPTELRLLELASVFAGDEKPGAAEISAAWRAVLGTCAGAGVDPLSPARFDLAQMRERSYMQLYFQTRREDAGE